MSAPTNMPERLRTIVDAFRSAPKPLRLQLLLEYARKLPPLPAEFEGRRDAMERVDECQTPIFLAARVEDGAVRLAFDAPPEAPTTRGFAGILSEGLEGADPELVLDVPDDFYGDMGLAEVISPLRLRGMGGMLARVKRQVREAASAA